MRTSKLKSAQLTLASVMAAVLTLSACSSGDPSQNEQLVAPGGEKTETPVEPEEPEPLTVDEVTAAIFAGVDPNTLTSGERPERASGIEMIAPEVVAEVSGAIASAGPTAPTVAVQFAAVDAYPDKTVVRFSMRSANGEEQSMPTLQELSRNIASDYFDGVALLEESVENVLYYPLSAQVPDSLTMQCLCSKRPHAFYPKDHWFYALYPALNAEAETVKIELKGLDPTEVPVVWVESE